MAAPDPLSQELSVSDILGSSLRALTSCCFQSLERPGGVPWVVLRLQAHTSFLHIDTLKAVKCSSEYGQESFCSDSDQFPLPDLWFSTGVCTALPPPNLPSQVSLLGL